MVRPIPAGRRGSCCTPYSRLQEEIDNVETIAVTANNTANNASQLAQQAIDKDTFDDLNINGDLNVYGDIIQQGAAYETHAQHVFSTDDYIVMRDGALVGLAVGDYSGFQVKKYDGTNDGRLVIDRDGTARVGDVGDEQPLATRDESSDLTDDHLVKWDAANLKLVDAGVGTDGMLELYDEGSYTTGILTPHNTYSMGIPMSAGKSFETGYDYFINVTCISDFEMNIKSTRDIESPGNTSISIQMQAGSISAPTLTYAVYRISNGGNAPVVNVIGMCSVRQQVKLVSGTNIKTINGNSLLGSGDLQISGGGSGEWTKRTANDDWTDLFDISGNIKAKKNIFFVASNISMSCFIPKNYEGTTNIYLYSPISSGLGTGGRNISTVMRVAISKTNVPSSSTTFATRAYGYTFTFDGTSLTVTANSNIGTDVINKSAFTIYTSD